MKQVFDIRVRMRNYYSKIQPIHKHNYSVMIHCRKFLINYGCEMYMLTNKFSLQNNKFC